MKSTRGGKHHSFSGTSSNQGYSQNFAGQRKGSVKYGGSANSANANSSYPNSSASSNSNSNPNSSAPSSTSSASVDAQNRLIGLLANATGKSVVATVSSGARYRGVLSSLNLGLAGQDSLSIVLVKPTLVSKSLIEEKSNVDSKLPGKLIVEAKDLIDIEIAQALVAEPLMINVKEKTPEPISLTQTETTTETTVPAKNEAKQEVGEETAADALAKETPKEAPKEAPKAPEQSPKVTPKATPGVSPKPWDASKNAAPSPVSTAPQNVAPKAVHRAAPENSQSFKTDRDISSAAVGASFKERELQRWVPDADTPELVLEDTGFSSGRWDQFQVNQDKFGVESSYDEHLYTTKINTQAKDYRERLQRAEKLAREIEGSASSDRHILEERGVTVDDSGMDEEDKYSGVIQDPVVDNRGNELMAALRNVKVFNAVEPAPVSVADGKYTTPRQRAAQYHNDPAIISSSATRKVPNEKPNNAASQAPPQNQGQSQVQGEASEKKKAASQNQAQAPAQQGEAFRLNAQSEFNALREFSANFKIPHKIPNDLLPILAKDKLKQDEILRKQESREERPEATEVSVSADATGADKKAQASTGPALAKAVTASGASAPKKEGNKFKLNPKAAAFTPSKPQPMSPVPPKAGFQKPASNSPRLHNQRPFSSSSSGSGSGRRYYHQITAAEFFGGADKVPSPESQKKKTELFRKSFNMFATAVRKHAEKGADSGPLVLEKAFWTPPTWDSTVEETYAQLVAQNSAKPEFTMSPAPHPSFMASPIMSVPNGVPPMGAAYGAAPGGGGGKFGMSPPVQQPMVAQFQQPFHPSMMYPQFQGGVPPGQPQVMYAPPGVDPSLFPSGGFMMPGYMGGPAPINGASYNAMSPQSPGQNTGHHHGGRRYNQGKRGNSER